MVRYRCGLSVGKIIEAFTNLVRLIGDRPWTIFIVFTLAFGYAYYDQNKDINSLSLEVGGLRTEVKHMNEIIELKVELAEKECPIEE